MLGGYSDIPEYPDFIPEPPDFIPEPPGLVWSGVSGSEPGVSESVKMCACRLRREIVPHILLGPTCQP